MQKKIEEFINKAVQVAKYAALPSSNKDTAEQMIADLETEGEQLQKEVTDALR